MKCKSLKQLWGGLFKKKGYQESPAPRQSEALQVAPLTAGLRMDLTVPTGAGKEMAVSQFIWVSPAGSDSRSVKALKVLLLPN
jgi:hypothetical protein